MSLCAEKITVTFGGIDVVCGVDLEIKEGEIHALVGENGAGKSSLAKVMAGVHKASSGRIVLHGKPIELKNPRGALLNRIALIHQEPLTFPDLTVAENIFVGNLRLKRGWVSWRTLHRESQRLLEALGISLDTRLPVRGLSVAKRQQIELAAAMAHSARVWIFDETSAPLTPKEASELFAVMRSLRDEGCAVLMVTHHLQEVFAVSDRITVLRDGHKVGERKTAETHAAEIVRLMVGRDLAQRVHSKSVLEPSPAVALQVSRLTGHGFDDVSLTVCEREIVGLGGLVGAGRTELAQALFGVSQVKSGEIKLTGKVAKVTSPADARALGLALVPEDRIHEGLFLAESIEFNSTIADLKGLWLNKHESLMQTQESARQLNLAHRSLQQPVAELSGGNQQKVVLSKWLMTRPKVLILDEPTRGVDVGAKHEVHRVIKQLASEGMAVLLISSDLPELLSLSDRIYVMRGGRIRREIPGESATEADVMQAATEDLIE